MEDFSTSKIIGNNEIIAKELKRSRLEKKIELSQASADLKMNIRYLEALERGDFSELPNGVYRINFLREYAIYLGLSSTELTKLFGEDEKNHGTNNGDELFIKRAANVHYFVTIPRLVKNFLLVSAVLTCFFYVGYYLNNIISPPILHIYNPSENIVTEDREIFVKGSTDPEAEIRINDELILSDAEGIFEKKVNLKTGLNTIVVVANKKYSRKKEEIKKILVNIEQEI